MIRVSQLLVFVFGASFLAGSCQQSPQSRSSAATLDEICVALTGEFRIPSDPNGPPDSNQNNEVELFRRLATNDVSDRAEAAKKLLRHSERRVPATLDAAIRVAGILGDYRTLVFLPEMFDGMT